MLRVHYWQEIEYSEAYDIQQRLWSANLAGEEPDSLLLLSHPPTYTIGKSGKIENLLVDALRRLLAVVENYPNLKASDHFLELQRELANTEDRIQAARRFYNGNVRDMNTRIEAFPSNIIAALFRFELQEFFEIADVGARQTPQASFD